MDASGDDPDKQPYSHTHTALTTHWTQLSSPIETHNDRITVRVLPYAPSSLREIRRTFLIRLCRKKVSSLPNRLNGPR